MSHDRHMLVIGASGVIGAGAIEHFTHAPGWRVTAISRRYPVVATACRFTHMSLDLTDHVACAEAVATLAPVTHAIYAAVAEAPGLIAGWYNDELIALNGRMLANILHPLVAAGHLRHLSLLQGTKAYGAHHHAVEVPAREDRPRDNHANFYWLHEDLVRDTAKNAGFAFTIFRPQVLLGSVAGVAMNPVAAIGAYAALCRELGRPFAYPGQSTAFWEVVDTGLLAEAFEWATRAAEAADETFNITNGDVLVPRHAWRHISDALNLRDDGKPPSSLVAFFAEDVVQAAWARLAARHALCVETLPALLGESHHYADLLLGSPIKEKAVPLLVSTIKIRQAGFAPCRDSVASLLHWIGRMVELKLLPPMGAST